MFEKLERMLARYKELEGLISDNSVICDQERWQKLVKEHSALEKPVTLYLQYLKVLNDIKECEELLEIGDDKEMVALAKEEHSIAVKERDKLTGDLKVALLPVDPND